MFLDRDDTLMRDVVYCRSPSDVRLLPGAVEGIRALTEAGFLVVIATNQSGIGRGYFSESELNEVNERLRSELRARGADFDALYYCPHPPEEGCDCRKPKPGLILRAASDLGIDLTSSYTVGDRGWDIEAGRAAGTHTILVTNGRPLDVGTAQADHVVNTLREAAGIILRSQAGGRN